MEKPKIKYDEMSDTLTVIFELGKPSVGIELTNNILLRINPQTGQAVSLNFFDFSILSQASDIGSRSFPLTGLTSLSKELQENTLQILQSKPASDFLQVSAYTPSLHETIPIILLQPAISKMVAA
ncbi:DUF2283 domain-containing protein [Kovacikia minuta CCNUW1]|uniref:DUF2283 domain-containing protein n=1 Tax=Kovacikia minuta TaxID=2931930 RepID=UPI001CCC050D|nr:DUF2283 domain-containing protein [Kovacikia minuta]UBF27206.1 DUF2283 domain-containing protein [Kovacikia minuta CCNUW1]